MKYLKMIIMAALIIGVVVGLIVITNPGGKGTDGPELNSTEAKTWKEKIDNLCSKDNWKADGYNSIETGIISDYEIGGGTLISLDEKLALQDYLFAASCSHLNKQVDELFKQSSYPQDKVNTSDYILSFLKSKSENFGVNSNLKQAEEMLSEYHRLMSILSLSSHATYSRPLKPFNALSAETANARIKGLKYYGSHFSNNSSITSRVSNYESDRRRTESDYYRNLADVVVNYYLNHTDEEEYFLDDQIKFSEISTNKTATDKINNFRFNP